MWQGTPECLEMALGMILGRSAPSCWMAQQRRLARRSCLKILLGMMPGSLVQQTTLAILKTLERQKSCPRHKAR